MNYGGKCQINSSTKGFVMENKSKKEKLLFIDRDGNLILEPADEQIDDDEKIECYPEGFSELGKIDR